MPRRRPTTLNRDSRSAPHVRFRALPAAAASVPALLHGKFGLNGKVSLTLKVCRADNWRRRAKSSRVIRDISH